MMRVLITMRVFLMFAYMNSTSCCPNGSDPAKAVVHLRAPIVETHRGSPGGGRYDRACPHHAQGCVSYMCQ
eukprot:3433079-Lingulodinium_polyedra.AAC.1